LTPVNQGTDQDDEPDEDVVELLDDKEALEFDPTVEPTMWTPSQAMVSFRNISTIVWLMMRKK